MAQQTINVGSTPNDGTGDPARTAFTKCNDNFTELYARSGGIGPPQGRLSLAASAPVMTTTQTAKTLLYYLPYVGNLVPIYDGTTWTMTSIGPLLSITTTDTTKNPAAVGASQVLDWFIWSDAGTLRLSHGPAWSSDTARSAGTNIINGGNGIWLNDASITNACAALRGTYVGTTRSNASSTIDWQYGAVASPPTEIWFGVWNAYNRVDVAAFTGESATNWTYASTTPHAVNARNSYRASVIVGLNEDSLLGIYSTHAALNTVGGTIGIGYDSTSVFSANGSAQASSTSLQSGVTAEIAITPAIGWHYIQALEVATTAGTAAFYGAFQLSMSKLFVSYRM